MSHHFKGEHNGHEITAYIYTDGSITFTTDALQEPGAYGRTTKEFASLSSIEAAIDKYELSLRKNFKNTTAYMVVNPHYRSERAVEAVKITSITQDGKEAWIKTPKDDRRKVRLDELYKDREVCQAYIDALVATTAVYEKERETLKSIVDRHLWTPEVES